MSWLFVILMMFFTTSYQSTLALGEKDKKVPPGQMKKSDDRHTGKPHQPGQQQEKNH
jgi:hypothetical protein